MRHQKVERIEGGVWCLPVPIPDNPLGYTLVYLIETDAGPVLIDAGWHSPAGIEALESGIAEAGFDIADVHGVAVTHCHPDHNGLSGEVRDRSGAWVAIHAADAAVVRGQVEWQTAEGSDRSERWRRTLSEAMHAAGAPDDEVEAMFAHQASITVAVPPLPDRTFEDGELLDVPGRSLRSVWTPGHSPGHSCFHLEDSQRVFAGDHLLPTITPHVGLYESAGPTDDPLGEFLASVRRVADLRPVEVLPAHEYRFDSASDRAAEILEHHEERLRQVEESVDAGETLWDITAAMQWNRPWEQIAPMMRRIALSEAHAHVRHLEMRGRIAPVDDPLPPTYRRPTRWARVR